MKPWVLTAVLFVFWLPELGSQGQFQLPRGIKVWFTSAPAAADLVGMVTRYNEPRYSWSRLRPHISIFQHYQAQTITRPPANVEGNTYNILSREGFFRTLRHLKIDQAIEVAAVKTYSCSAGVESFGRVIDAAVDSALQVYRAGGNVRYLTIDSSLVGGLECRSRILSLGQVAQLVSIFIREVRWRFESRIQEMAAQIPNLPVIPLEIGDVEPYPGFAVGLHKGYLTRILSETAKYRVPGPSHYHLDVDIKLIKDDQLFSQDVRELAAFLKANNIKFGLIVNGEDVDSAQEYFRTANEKLVRYRNQGLAGTIDHLIIQSWAMSSNGRKNLPANVPEGDSYTHTNFGFHVLGCFFGEDWDCKDYPGSR